MIKAVRIGFVIAAGLLLGLLPSPAHAEESGLSLDISASKSQYAPGEPIELKFTVTNRGPTPCQVATVPDATVQLVSVKHDGASVSPSFSQGFYGDGVGGSVLRSLRQVAPGASVSFTMTGLATGGADGSSLITAVASPAGDALVASWPVGTDGRYDISAGYAVPRVNEPGTPLCTGATNIATAGFTVGSPPQAFPWLIVLIGLGVVLVVVVAVLLWRRCHRRGARGVAAMIVFAGAAGVMVTGTGIARAAYEIEGDATFKAEVQGCFTHFELTDPWKIMNVIKDPAKAKVRIIEHPAIDGVPNTFATPLGPNGPKSSTVVWNRDPARANLEYEPGNPMDKCGSLYHELVHAEGISTNTTATGNCRSTGISNEEVRASYAENDYLGTLNKERKTYERKPLPPRGDAKKKNQLPPECKAKPKTQKKAKTACGDTSGDPPAFTQRFLVLNGESRSAKDDCSDNSAQTNGDPHLTTFDQYNYDFQAVGEFVSAKAGGDFEVQARQSPVPFIVDRTVSVNSAVAMRVGQDRVGFYAENVEIVVRVNGRVESLVPGDKNLSGGGVVTRRPGFREDGPDGYTLTWPDGSVAELDGISYWGIRLLVSASEKRKRQLTGLLGNFDGNKDNDLVTRDGKSVSMPPGFEQLHRTLGDSWRIAQAESLFDYAPGESTEKSTDPSFPERERTVKDLPEGQREQAREACRLGGVTDPTLLDQCILDVALTGQATFAVNAGDTQSILPETSEPAPGPVDPGGVVRDGDTVKGKLDAPGERDVYQLDLGEATEFQFVEQTGEISIEPEKPGLWKRAMTPEAGWRGLLSQALSLEFST